MEKSKILRLSDLVKPVASATAFFTTLVILSVAYAGWSTPVPTVATGQALTKALWDNLANELADHDSKIAGQEAKTANISSVGGNVGVWAANPGAKLEVGGQLKITGGTPGAGKVLTSDANGLANWQTPAVTGKVLQVGYAQKTDSWSAATSGDNFYTVPGLSITLTPASTNSKVLITTSLYAGAGNYQIKFRLLRNGVPVVLGAGEGGRPVTTGMVNPYSSTSDMQYQVAFIWGNHMDSPTTTAPVTYEVQMAAYSGYSVYLNRSPAWQNAAASGYDATPVSTITAMEIGN